MTSKEVFESIRNEYYTENGRKIVVIGRDDERFDIVEKDLEVLDILKNKRVNINKISKVGKLENYNSICAIGTDLTFEEYKAIKNWLERKD